MKEKVVLAYSGGLDTTAVIPWLKENYDYDVVCCCVNVCNGNSKPFFYRINTGITDHRNKSIDQG